MRFSSFIIGLTTSITFTVQAANVDEYINQLPAGANLALMVQKVGAQAPEIDYHSQQMALPASTQKVITASPLCSSSGLTSVLLPPLKPEVTLRVAN